jgi:hypothetical protein
VLTNDPGTTSDDADLNYEGFKALAKKLGRPLESMCALAGNNDLFTAGHTPPPGGRRVVRRILAEFRDGFEAPHPTHPLPADPVNNAHSAPVQLSFAGGLNRRLAGTAASLGIARSAQNRHYGTRALRTDGAAGRGVRHPDRLDPSHRVVKSMAKDKKQSTTLQVSKPTQQPAAPRRAYLQVTEAGQRGEDLPQLLERLWKEFEAGDNRALLDLIVWSLDAGILPPRKARTEFGARYDPWRLGDVRSLDAAFGVQRRKGKHVALRVKRHRGGHADKRPGREQYRRHIVVRVYELHLDEGMPIDKALFAKVDEELGLGTDTAHDIFYEPASRPWREIAATGCLRVTPRKAAEV